MKTLKDIVTAISLSVLLFSCGSGEDDVESKPVTESIKKENNGVFLQEINNESLVQYTPNTSPWNNFKDFPIKIVPKYNSVAYKSNALKDIPLMSKEDWESNKWDGIPFNPEKLTRKELHEAMFPNQHQIMIGLKQLYERHSPFKDEKYPTKAEVDEWNRLVINHFRALCGYGAEKYKVKNSHTLYIMALWSDEAKYTTKWDNVPYRNGKTVSQDKKASGNYLKDRLHYGFGFTPPENKQKSYFPSGVNPVVFYGTAEGVSGVRKWQPWSTKLSAVLGNMIQREGFWGGHLGPLWHREKIGISYYKELPREGTDDRWVQVRLLYHGELRTSLYTDPDGPDKKNGVGKKY